jgi:hypothetical protein
MRNFVESPPITINVYVEITEKLAGPDPDEYGPDCDCESSTRD